MRFHLFFVPILGLLLATLVMNVRAGPKDGANKDKNRLQGTWTMVSGEIAGEKPSKDDLQVYEFRGEVVITRFKGITLGAVKFTVDESQKPKEMDFIVGDKTNPAIYQLDGDRLKICMDKPGGGRPKRFKTEAGTSQKLFVFKRGAK